MLYVKGYDSSCMSKFFLHYFRLEYAKTLFTAGIERGGSSELCNVKELLRKTERFLADAKKDNDFIYHERVPDVKSLPAIAKAAVAKPTKPLPPKLGNSQAELFDALCPVAIHQAMAAYDLRKQDIVNKEVSLPCKIFSSPK